VRPIETRWNSHGRIDACKYQRRREGKATPGGSSGTAGRDHPCKLAIWKRGGEALPSRVGSRFPKVGLLKLVEGDGTKKVPNRQQADECTGFGDS
jgi:hypothetical protein